MKNKTFYVHCVIMNEANTCYCEEIVTADSLLRALEYADDIADNLGDENVYIRDENGEGIKHYIKEKRQEFYDGYYNNFSTRFFKVWLLRHYSSYEVFDTPQAYIIKQWHSFLEMFIDGMSDWQAVEGYQAVCDYCDYDGYDD